MAYCSVEDLKKFGYTITEDNEADMERICEIASAKVESYCHQSFTRHEGAKEKHLIRIKDGVAKIFPRNLTVSAVNSVTFFSINPKNPISYTIENLVYMPSGAVIVGSTNAPMGEYFTVLDYDYGFADGDYPADLVQATALMAIPSLDDYFVTADTNMSGLKTLQQGKLKIERGTLSANAMLNSQGVPANAAALLDGGGYVRVRGAWL
jgi:hypothetical protein